MSTTMPSLLASLALAIFGLMAALPLHANPGSADPRDGYGANHWPIWSKLTHFESAALSDLPKARENQPDALLGLYLVASGTRELDDYETVNRRITAFARGIKDALSTQDSAKVIGEKINAQMHETFFLKESKSKAPSGYAADQSRLMGIFETGEFNCISSAMLYAVLARQLDLKVQGVLLPSHAFIQLDAPSGAIDIETTSKTGFALVHNADFYNNQSMDWYELRGLSPATYDDYLTRQRISPTILAAKNMLNQHTSEQIMDKKDSARLAEISAYINPADTFAQERRLWFYNREYHQLAKDSAWPSLARLYQTTYAQVMTDVDHLAYPPSLIEPLLYFQMGALVSHSNAGDADNTLAVLQDVLNRHPAVPNKKKEIENGIAHAIHVLTEKLVDNHLFEEALLIVPSVQVQLPEHAAWPKILRWIYLRWAEHYQQQNQWQDVIYTIEEWFGEPTSAADDKKALKMLANAYQQLVVKALRNHAPETAETHVERCTSHYSAAVCGKGSAKLQQYRAANRRAQKS